MGDKKIEKIEEHEEKKIFLNKNSEKYCEIQSKNKKKEKIEVNLQENAKK